MKLPFVIITRAEFDRLKEREQRAEKADKMAQAQRAWRANANPDGKVTKSVAKRLEATVGPDPRQGTLPIEPTGNRIWGPAMQTAEEFKRDAIPKTPGSTDMQGAKS
jgi:hypothetical protein